MQKFISDTFTTTGIKLTPSQIRAFEVYEQELLEWNARFNLTAIRDVEGIRTKHFLDSLTCFPELASTSVSHLIDVGTGAGFPGIPLKIIMPSMHLVLVESVGKKATFCRHITTELGLENVEIISSRAEDLGQQSAHREKYDWALARAVASMPILAEYLLPLVRVGGSILAQKGENAHAEAHSAEKAYRVLGGKLKHISKIILPGVADERYLVTVEKVAATPSQYPRRAGIPAKMPLQ